MSSITIGRVVVIHSLSSLSSLSSGCSTIRSSSILLLARPGEFIRHGLTGSIHGPGRRPIAAFLPDPAADEPSHRDEHVKPQAKVPILLLVPRAIDAAVVCPHLGGHEPLPEQVHAV